jgi:DNA-binding transcriptional LysR family regulator
MVDGSGMETRRLRLLVELQRLGSMRAVAAELGSTTSTVSSQLAALAAELRTPLLEPDGRRVRLTPAGHRLAEHAVEVLAAVDAAMVDLSPSAPPRGTVRVAGFATGLRRSVIPALPALRRRHPALQVALVEHEPTTALDLLAADQVDLAVVFDYSLDPWSPPPGLRVWPLWSVAWGVLVPAILAPSPDGEPEPAVPEPAGDGDTPVAADLMRLLAGQDWIVDSRHDSDEAIVRALTRLAGVPTRTVHRVDDLTLVQDMVAAGLGVGLYPHDRPLGEAVRLLPLRRPELELRCWVTARRGRERWAPVAALLELLLRPPGAADANGDR